MKATGWLPLFFTLSCLFPALDTRPQNLSFTNPVAILPEVRTDRAVDITRFRNGFFMTWKGMGPTGPVGFAYLGRQYDTGINHSKISLPAQLTAFGPVWRSLGERLYLLWITEEGGLNYMINSSDTSMDTAHIHKLPLSDGTQFSQGLSAAAVGRQMVITCHAADKQHLLYALTAPGPDGLLQPAAFMPVPGRGSPDQPFVASLGDQGARFCWRGIRDQAIYCADLAISDGKFNSPATLAKVRTGQAPALYQVWKTKRLFYIWKGAGSDRSLYYATDTLNAIPSRTMPLPPAFVSDLPVSICATRDDQCILAFTGQDNRIYLSFFVNYNSASWMQDILHCATSQRTLQDIVIPGSHDAGMSVLSGTGGAQAGTINNCNTLTQQIPVGDQLRAGIRMFDLRIGTFRDRLYTKHSAADCMSDAIGGAYGERLADILQSIHSFLRSNPNEVVLLTFSHFCEKETPTIALADSVINGLGRELIFRTDKRPIGVIPLRELAGKVILTFEQRAGWGGLIDSCTIAAASKAFVNFRREYAATNDMSHLVTRQEAFFKGLSSGQAANDLIRLDWQLTQSSDEAALVCNDFQDDKVNPLFNGAMLLTNIVRNHKSIVDLAAGGNKYLPARLNDWIAKGIVTPKNKPNILYVDVAGPWITDYCLSLNDSELYTGH